MENFLTNILNAITNFSFGTIIPGISNFPITNVLARMPLLLSVFIIGAFYFIYKYKYNFIKSFIEGGKALWADKGGIDKIGSLNSFLIQTALNLNVVSIVLIVVVITYFGPGVLFWLWIFELITVVYVYVEGVLSQKYKYLNDDNLKIGGIHHYSNWIWKNNFGNWIGRLTIIIFILMIPIQLNITIEQAELVIPTEINSLFVMALVSLLMIVPWFWIINKKIDKRYSLLGQLSLALMIILGVIFLGYIIVNPGSIITFFQSIFSSALNIQTLVGGSFIYLLTIMLNKIFTTTQISGGINSYIISAVDDKNETRQAHLASLSSMISVLVFVTIICFPIVVSQIQVNNQDLSFVFANAFKLLEFNDTTTLIFGALILVVFILLTIISLSVQFFYSYEIMEYIEVDFFSQKILKVFILVALLGGLYVLANLWILTQLIALLITLCLILTGCSIFNAQRAIRQLKKDNQI